MERRVFESARTRSYFKQEDLKHSSEDGWWIINIELKKKSAHHIYNLVAEELS